MTLHLGRPPGLLLDFGSVIGISVFERHRITELNLDLPPGTLDWLGPLDPSTDPLWQAMQRDELTERDYWAHRAHELGRLVGEDGWDVPTMLRRARQIDPNAMVRPGMTSLVHLARARGMRLGILSNELELFYGADFLAGMDIVRDMETVIDATHTGILKPDPRAYLAAAEAMGLPPEQILFVDDQFRNVAGALEVGMQVHHFDLRDVDGQIDALAARCGVSIKELHACPA